jgi:hypothetical protein
LTLPATIVPAVGIADVALPGHLFDRPLAVIAVFMLSGLAVMAAAGAIVWMWNHRRREVLSHRGLLCPRCRYPLDQLRPEAACCPECGTINDRTAIVQLWRKVYRIDRTELSDPAAPAYQVGTAPTGGVSVDSAPPNPGILPEN